MTVVEGEIEPHEVRKQGLPEIEQHALRHAFQPKSLLILHDPGDQSIASIEADEHCQTCQISMHDVAIQTEFDQIWGKEVAQRNPEHTDRGQAQMAGIWSHKRPQAAYNAGVIGFSVTFFFSSTCWPGPWPLLATLRRPHDVGTCGIPCGAV